MGMQLARLWMQLFGLVMMSLALVMGAILLAGLWLTCKLWFCEHQYEPEIPDCRRCGWVNKAKTGR